MTLSPSLAAGFFCGMLVCSSVAGQPLELNDCRITAGPAYPSIKARCADFDRPVDPARPDAEQISLRVAVVPALTLEPAMDAFVPIAGGPGQSTIEFYGSIPQAFEEIRRKRDIVLLDQRGTGSSARLNCELDEEAVQGRMSAEQTRAATLACLDQLAHDPRYFTTSVAVTDLDALRAALGYDAFNLYGISYGSRVAQHFARRYPEVTRSVVLDGVVPPQVALGPAIATKAQQALDAVFARCAEDINCQQRFPNLETAFDVLQQALEDDAIVVHTPHPVHGTLETVDFAADELATTLRLLSYHPTTVALIPLLLDEAANGNLAPLAAQFLSISSTLADSIAIGMHNAVACTEDAPFFAGEDVAAADLEATYIGPILLEALSTICNVWPVGVLDEGFKTPLATDKPVLLLSGEADPITPPAYASLAAVDLTRAYLHTGALQGHGQAPRGCMPRILAAFVETPEDNPLTDSCLDEPFAMPFFLDYSGPSP